MCVSGNGCCQPSGKCVMAESLQRAKLIDSDMTTAIVWIIITFVTQCILLKYCVIFAVYTLPLMRVYSLNRLVRKFILVWFTRLRLGESWLSTGPAGASHWRLSLKTAVSGSKPFRVCFTMLCIKLSTRDAVSHKNRLAFKLGAGVKALHMFDTSINN